MIVCMPPAFLVTNQILLNIPNAGKINQITLNLKYLISDNLAFFQAILSFNNKEMFFMLFITFNHVLRKINCKVHIQQ